MYFNKHTGEIFVKHFICFVCVYMNVYVCMCVYELFVLFAYFPIGIFLFIIFYGINIVEVSLSNIHDSKFPVWNLSFKFIFKFTFRKLFFIFS